MPEKPTGPGSPEPEKPTGQPSRFPNLDEMDLEEQPEAPWSERVQQSEPTIPEATPEIKPNEVKPSQEHNDIVETTEAAELAPEQSKAQENVLDVELEPEGQPEAGTEGDGSEKEPPEPPQPPKPPEFEEEEDESLKKQAEELGIDTSKEGWKEKVKKLAEEIKEEETREEEAKEEVEEEKTEEEKKSDALEEFVAIQEVFNELRRRDIEHRYGRSIFSRIRAWLAGEDDYSLTHEGELRRDNLRFLARKALVTIFNRRTILGGVALAGVGVMTGGIGLAALTALGGGILGNAAAEIWQARSKNNPEIARLELLQTYLESTRRLIPKIQRERELESPEQVLQYLNAVINEIYRENSALIQEKHQRILDLERIWNTRKALLYGAGALAGGILGAVWQTHLENIQHLRQFQEITQHIGWRDYNGDGIYHYVIKVGNEFYYGLRPQDWAYASAHQYPLHGFSLPGISGLWHQMYPNQALPHIQTVKSLSSILANLDLRFLAVAGGALAGLREFIRYQARPLRESELAEGEQLPPKKPELEVGEEETEKTEEEIPEADLKPLEAAEGVILPDLQEGNYYLIVEEDKEKGGNKFLIIQYMGKLENQDDCLINIIKGSEPDFPVIAQMVIPFKKLEKAARVLVVPGITTEELGRKQQELETLVSGSQETLEEMEEYVTPAISEEVAPTKQPEALEDTRREPVLATEEEKTAEEKEGLTEMSKNNAPIPIENAKIQTEPIQPEKLGTLKIGDVIFIARSETNGTITGNYGKVTEIYPEAIFYKPIYSDKDFNPLPDQVSSQIRVHIAKEDMAKTQEEAQREDKFLIFEVKK